MFERDKGWGLNMTKVNKKMPMQKSRTIRSWEDHGAQTYHKELLYISELIKGKFWKIWTVNLEPEFEQIRSMVSLITPVTNGLHIICKR